MALKYSLSVLEKIRFGISSARAELDDLSAAGILLERCRADGITFLVVRIPTSSVDIVQALERQGFFLTDTLLEFKKNLEEGGSMVSGQTTIRRVRKGEEELVRIVASQAFKGYFGHYHADPRFSSADCDDVYSDWAFRGCSQDDIADCVLVAEDSGAINGFSLIKIRGAGIGEGRLYGVHPNSRGQGIYRDLVIAAMNWLKEQGCREMLESTQVTNRVSQKVWAQLGFEPVSSFYTLHKWFD